MKVELKRWQNSWHDLKNNDLKDSAQLVLAFGERKTLESGGFYKQIKDFYPHAEIVICSSAGEISEANVTDSAVVVAALKFDKTKLTTNKEKITDPKQSEEVGEKLAKSLEQEGLAHVMVFADGQKTNGTTLVKGLVENLPKEVAVTGCLVGDGHRFETTLDGLDEEPVADQVVAIGFYGQDLKIGFGSLGGWDPFGPERTITKSDGNILYELDNEPALKLYKEYLGDEAKNLPGSGLLFPLRLKVQGEENEVVRTILAVDEDKQSMTFAGSMPEGALAKLMKANFERLIDGAAEAAEMSAEPLGKSEPDLAVLISCIGRKLVLGDQIEEEVEAVAEKLGTTNLIGFYSYGEISPGSPTKRQCQLHNQTMTITTFKEK